MPKIISTALWSPEEIAALQRGQAIETFVNGQQVFHQAERPRKAKVEVVAENGAMMAITDNRKDTNRYRAAWTPERRAKMGEITRQRNLLRKRKHGIFECKPCGRTFATHNALNAHQQMHQ